MKLWKFCVSFLWNIGLFLNYFNLKYILEIGLVDFNDFFICFLYKLKLKNLLYFFLKKVWWYFLYDIVKNVVDIVIDELIKIG